MNKNSLEITLDSIPEQNKALAELIGIDLYLELTKHFGGTSIYILKNENVFRKIRDTTIRKEFDGSNYRELAVKYSLSEVWVRNIINT